MNGRSRVEGIVLAAGAARRFGGDKLCAPLRGVPLGCAAVRAALASRLRTVHVVTGEGDLAAALRRCFPRQPRLRVYRLTRPGPVAASLRAGFRALGDEARAAMVLLADMPFVTPRIIDDLVATFERSGALVVATCRGRWRHPRVIPADLFDAFRSLRDGGRGRDIVDAHRGRVVTVDGGDPMHFVDIDTPEDLEGVRASSG